LSLTPAEIFEKVEAKYLSLDSIAFDSTIVRDIDTTDSEIDGKHHKITTTCKVRLARPSYYRIEWKQPTSGSYVHEGVAWSSGVRHHFRSTTSVSEYTDIDSAFAAVRGSGAEQTIPNVFFQRPDNRLRYMKNAALQPDENVGGLDCHVVSGDTAAETKLTFWITKDFLIIQKRETQSTNVDILKSAAEAKEKMLERLESSRPELAAYLKEARQNAKERMLRMKSWTTETIESVVLNPPLEKEIFESEELRLPSLPR
jgi:hypothetical protein